MRTPALVGQESGITESGRVTESPDTGNFAETLSHPMEQGFRIGLELWRKRSKFQPPVVLRRASTTMAMVWRMSFYLGQVSGESLTFSVPRLRELSLDPGNLIVV